MLKTIKTNINTCKRGYKPLDVQFSSVTTDNKAIFFSEEQHLNLMSNDSLLLRRVDGRRIDFSLEVGIEDVYDSKKFSIKELSILNVIPSSYEVVEYQNTSIASTVGSGSTMFIKFSFLEEDKHIFCVNRDDVEDSGIKGYYDWNSQSNTYNYSGNKHFCEGDYVLYDGSFLKQILSGDTESEILNIKDVVLDTSLGDDYKLINCIVTVNRFGYDNRYELLVPFDGNEWYCEDIDNKFLMVSLYCSDTRFWETDYTFKDGTVISKLTGDLEIDFGICENFSTDLMQNERLLNYAEEIAEKSVNSVINYERYPYNPMFYSGDTSYSPESGRTDKNADEYFYNHSFELDEKLLPVKKINFNLNFRTKGYEVDEFGERDYGTWSTDEKDYWNNFVIRNDGKVLTPVYDTITGGTTSDLLGHLGFTDDDVFYQKDCLKKSFLRLSFYDTPYRETQKLLFYSTVYFDTNELYKKYCNILSLKEKKRETIEEMFVYDASKEIAEKGLMLNAVLSCTDRFDSESSADGFYLHLFDKMVSGNTCSMVYMKAEFNNAKFGKSIPLTLPTFKDSNEAIWPTNQKFPKNYLYEGKRQGVDMSKLLSDMYIKVMLKFDYKTNEYVWFLPVKSTKQEMTLTLFEPRVTGYDVYSYMKNIGDGYGTDTDLPRWIDLSGSFESVSSAVSETCVIYRDSNGDTESEYMENNPTLSVLYTTACTLSNDSLIDGTALFNECGKRKIKGIWIDGIKVKDEMIDYRSDEFTTRYQLPDEIFEVSGAVFNSPTTKEMWVSKFNGTSYVDYFTTEEPLVKPKKIHSVNYYFEANMKDNKEMYIELCSGMTYSNNNRKLKTIETTKSVVDTITNNLDTSITITDTLTCGMFENIDSLRNVCFKRGIRTVGNGAFNNCKGLYTVDNDPQNGITCIGKNAFSGCRSLKEVYLIGIVNIMRQAFQGCYTLTNVRFDRDRGGNTGSEVTKYIGCAAFGYTNVRNIYLPDTIIRVGNSAFRRCYHLTSVSLPSGNGFNIGKQVLGNDAILKYVLKRRTHVEGTPAFQYNSGVNSPVMVSLVNKAIKSVYYDAKSGTFKNVSITLDCPVIKHYRDNGYRSYLETNKPYVNSFEEWNNIR